MKLLKIRLGGSCNQHCSFCHSSKDDNYTFNPKLIPFIKYNHFDKINYGGGEPLLYWNYMKMFMDTFPRIYHHVVTNGSLFNEEMLDYALKMKFRVAISLNEYTNISKHVLKLLSRVPELGYGVLYSGDKSLDQLDEEINSMNEKLQRDIHTTYNLMHTTNANHKVYNIEQMNEYINGITKRIDLHISKLMENSTSKYDQLTTQLLIRYNNSIPGCCNLFFTTVSLDGRIMSCAYDKSYLHTVDTELSRPIYNWKRCYDCKLKGQCRSCYKSVNDNECYILNKIYENLNYLLEKYNISYQQLFKLSIERLNNR